MPVVIKLSTFEDGEVCRLANFVEGLERGRVVEVVGRMFSGGRGNCTAKRVTWKGEGCVDTFDDGLSSVSASSLALSIRGLRDIDVGDCEVEGCDSTLGLRSVGNGVLDVTDDGSSKGRGSSAEAVCGSSVRGVGVGPMECDAFELRSLGVDTQVVGGKQSKKNARKRARAKVLRAQSRSDSGDRCSSGKVDAGFGGSGDTVARGLGDVECSSMLGRVEMSVEDGGSVVRDVSCEKKDTVKNLADGGTRFERSDLLSVTTGSERKELARQWFDRKTVENQLAIQRARYNVKRNEYLDRSRISEQRWETERLNCDAKLARISAARLGYGGSAQTVVSEEEKSLRPPSLSTGSDSPAELSDGTVSPDSSISVAEGVRLINKVKKVEGDYAEIKLKYDMLIKAVSMGGSKIVIDGKDIHEYDGTGQYVPPLDNEVESLYDGRGHLLDAWEAGMDY